MPNSSRAFTGSKFVKLLLVHLLSDIDQNGVIILEFFRNTSLTIRSSKFKINKTYFQKSKEIPSKSEIFSTILKFFPSILV